MGLLVNPPPSNGLMADPSYFQKLLNLFGANQMMIPGQAYTAQMGNPDDLTPIGPMQPGAVPIHAAQPFHPLQDIGNAVSNWYQNQLNRPINIAAGAALSGDFSTAKDQLNKSMSDLTPQSVQQGIFNAGLGIAPLGIVSPIEAKSLSTVLNLPNDPIFHAAIANTPGAKIENGMLHLNVQRSQLPEQELAPSVRGGVFYLPQGAAQAKYYSTGKNGYGGTQKISGETAYANPIFVKGATGGKAPQMAYDQLNGKGAYEAMRSEALNALPSWGGRTSRADQVGKVQNFLDKYAPEMSDYADYIIDNSKTSNQLPYALQEAAVASAARNVGHDAVIGYSKQKNGNPFISEIYDLRENSYPSPSGENSIWDIYKSGR